MSRALYCVGLRWRILSASCVHSDLGWSFLEQFVQKEFRGAPWGQGQSGRELGGGTRAFMATVLETPAGKTVHPPRAHIQLGKKGDSHGGGVRRRGTSVPSCRRPNVANRELVSPLGCQHCKDPGEETPWKQSTLGRFSGGKREKEMETGERENQQKHGTKRGRQRGRETEKRERERGGRGRDGVRETRSRKRQGWGRRGDTERWAKTDRDGRGQTDRESETEPVMGTRRDGQLCRDGGREMRRQRVK